MIVIYLLFIYYHCYRDFGQFDEVLRWLATSYQSATSIPTVLKKNEKFWRVNFELLISGALDMPHRLDVGFLTVRVTSE